MTSARFWPAILAGWAVAAVVLTLVQLPAIVHLSFPDPDDAMRLLEVRDWMAGQSWWDVSQHRLWGGAFPMHWSRIVDLPLAAVMAALDPLVGQPVSTRVAMVLVPLATLLAVMAGVALLTRRLAGREAATLAMMLATLSAPLVYQLRPMRIDHHGWQIALTIAAMLALIARPTARNGILAGVSLGLLVTISLEGLPIAAIIAGVAALAWAIEPARRGFVVALVTSMAIGALAAHVATRGPAMFVTSCDAVSPPWLAMLGVAATGLVLATAIPVRSTQARIALAAAAGAAALATLVLVAPQCARGPFATLNPLVRSIWYEHVTEGLPLWDQGPAWAAISIALPLVGLCGTMMALRASDGVVRQQWLLLLAVLVPTILLACLVNRVGATANALALPGASALLVTMLQRVRAIPRLAPRIAGTVAALLVASPGLAVGGVAMIAEEAAPPAKALARTNGVVRPLCKTFDDIRALARLPAGTVFLPLDVTPDLIATTRHRAISGGYHRNVAAMHAVLSAFTGTPGRAEQVIRRTRATYVAGCPGLNETELYRHLYPEGFWARLERGERFGWLAPIPMPGSPVLAWRVRPLPIEGRRP